MDGSAVANLASSLASAATLAKAMLSMKMDAEVRSAIISLQNDLISAQSAALGSLAEREDLSRQVKELEKQIAEIDNWESTSAKFKACSFPTSLHAYEAEGYDGIYCPKCFENRRLSRLQEHKSSNGFHKGECLQCETVLMFARARVTPAQRTNYW